MKVLVTGSSGLVGSALIPALESAGHDPVRLVRSSNDVPGSHWNPAGGEIHVEQPESMDGVVHLAGESIAEGRWTAEKKQRILESRTQGTQVLSEAIARWSPPPRVLVAASAIGYYGDRGEEICEETSPPGSGFLADVCRQWEAATTPASENGIRVVNLRIGVVLSSRGGALAKMLLPFKLGLGGRVGSGRQYMSWIAIDDLVGVILHCLENEPLRGPVNAVAPHPVTNRQFTAALGRVLHRPTILPMPALAARVALGEMADELLLASTRVRPARLEESGYDYRHAELEDALRNCLR